MADPDFLAARLAVELGDADMARELAALLEADTLCWTAPTIPAARIRTIIGFTFGNRMAANGNRLPGPVNEALAEVAVALHRETNAPIYAQWEVAEPAAERLPPDTVTPIHPGRDERGEPVYLSTGGVLEEIARRVDPAKLGPVCVVAFADHMCRCVMTARRLGFDAYAPEGHAMPRDYDPLSGQAWCRSRLAYLLHDLMIRITERRAEVLARGQPRHP
ncbi:MAG TPA: hypothetical protein VMU82_02600 [Acetobacteraceae bacterium]|nr:hypothetical protein [Acetobacteraceae bacterium]